MTHCPLTFLVQDLGAQALMMQGETGARDDMELEDGAAPSASEVTVYSEVKLSTKERGYDDAFEEIKRCLTTR